MTTEERIKIQKFLIDNNIKDEYKKAVKRHNNTPVHLRCNTGLESTTSLLNVIICSFDWSSSERGWDYWCDIDVNWRRRCINRGLGSL